MERWMDRVMDGWMDGWMDGVMNGWMDGVMDTVLQFISCFTVGQDGTYRASHVLSYVISGCVIIVDQAQLW